MNRAFCVNDSYKKNLIIFRTKVTFLTTFENIRPRNEKASKIAL